MLQSRRLHDAAREQSVMATVMFWHYQLDKSWHGVALCDAREKASAGPRLASPLRIASTSAMGNAPHTLLAIHRSKRQ